MTFFFWFVYYFKTNLFLFAMVLHVLSLSTAHVVWKEESDGLHPYDESGFDMSCVSREKNANVPHVSVVVRGAGGPLTALIVTYEDSKISRFTYLIDDDG